MDLVCYIHDAEMPKWKQRNFHPTGETVDFPGKPQIYPAQPTQQKSYINNNRKG
jgi:hypothetical protein